MRIGVLRDNWDGVLVLVLSVRGAPLGGVIGAYA